MSKLTTYYQKQRLIEKLTDELSKLEQDQALQKELKFKEAVKSLLNDFEKSPRELLDVLTTIDSSLATYSDTQAEKRTTRKMVTYKNPHTGEIVKTKGGNHKTLNQWRDEFGKDEVAGWKVDD